MNGVFCLEYWDFIFFFFQVKRGLTEYALKLFKLVAKTCGCMC